MVHKLAFAFAILALASGAGYGASTGSMPPKSGVSFISGGVGADAVERLKAREKEFNLKLVFTLTEGNYLADVGVRVTDAAGNTVIQHVADGPIFLARLPAGTYTVAATYNGKTEMRKITVGERLQTVYMRWSATAGRDVTLPPQGRETSSPGTAVSALSTQAPSTNSTSGSESPTGVPFIAGDVGENAEQQALARQSEFNLKLVFTLVEGNYLADVDVTIRDSSGKALLQQHVPGPFLLARLPEGTYSVSATYDGKARTKKVRVGNRLTTEYIRWPSDPNADFTLSPETPRR